MSPSRRHPAQAIAALALTLLLGCQSGYTLAVKNDTDQPVTVTVVETIGAQPSINRASKWLGPGDAATLGPGTSNTNARVELVADAKSNAFSPAIIQVPPGWTSYDIRRSETGRLIWVQRNQE
jgi:hypothetical protein